MRAETFIGTEIPTKSNLVAHRWYNAYDNKGTGKFGAGSHRVRDEIGGYDRGGCSAAWHVVDVVIADGRRFVFPSPTRGDATMVRCTPPELLCNP